MLPGLHVTNGDTAVTAMYVADSRSIAIAEMNLMPSSIYELERLGDFVWWICRVKVEPGYRRLGHGRVLVAELASRQRDYAMIVTPGGYDMIREDQEAFYAACGFVQQGDFMVRLKD